MPIKRKVHVIARFYLSISFPNLIKCNFYLSNNCLCFIFPLTYGHHGTFTDKQTNHSHITDILHTTGDLRHRIFTESMLGTFTDLPKESTDMSWDIQFHG